MQTVHNMDISKGDQLRLIFLDSSRDIGQKDFISTNLNNLININNIKKKSNINRNKGSISNHLYFINTITIHKVLCSLFLRLNIYDRLIMYIYIYR